MKFCKPVRVKNMHIATTKDECDQYYCSEALLFITKNKHLDEFYTEIKIMIPLTLFSSFKKSVDQEFYSIILYFTPF